MTSLPAVRRFIASSLALLLVACGGSGETTTTADAADALPPVVVDAWLTALASGDEAAAHGYVEPDGLAVMIGVENQWTVGETAALLESGLGAEVRRTYWSSFASGFSDFAGGSLDDVSVGRHREFTVDTVSFAEVMVTAAGVETPVITRRLDTGPWQVDLVATVGPAFTSLLRDFVTDVGDDDPTRVITAYEEVVLPGLRAASQLDSADRGLAAELARLDAVLREVS